MSLGITATIKVKAGQGQAFIAVFSDLQAQVRKNESGCLMYDLYRSKKDENVFVVMEKYVDQGALDAHGKTDYFRAAGAKMFPLLDGMPAVEQLNFVS